MIMVYAIAAPFWLLACVTGLVLFVFRSTRWLSAYVILVPTFGYWASLLTAGAVLLALGPVIGRFLDLPDWAFALIFLGSQAIAVLAGACLGGFLAYRISRAGRADTRPLRRRHGL
ncbi:hypothetical protein ACO2Q1_01785 [Brevundimonas sp. VNH65]|uniref:hypothetical protein n=1 Tax=Brevundimonas sp. VNH65 TaxID=3400917 RepID=UPI003C071C13